MELEAVDSSSLTFDERSKLLEVQKMLVKQHPTPKQTHALGVTDCIRLVVRRHDSFELLDCWEGKHIVD